jgi:hypothetical protein
LNWEEKIIREGKFVLVQDKIARNYLHVAEGTFGIELGAGLFTK